MSAEIAKKNTVAPGAGASFFSALDRTILYCWRTFISLKFGIFLLAVIGASCIYGTMAYASNAALGDNAVSMARGLFFESKWFVALLLVFATNLILSTWHVTVMSFSIWWKKEFRRDSSYYIHGSSPRAEVAVPGGITEVEAVLKKKFSRAHRDGNAFFAHRGILSRLGPTIVHIGILTVIFSVVAKAVLIWNGKIMTEGRFLAAEGNVSNIVYQPLAIEQQLTDRNRIDTPIDVWVKVLDFDERKHANSEVPSYFSSLVEILDPRTQEVTVAQLDMNHSLPVKTSAYGILRFHQAGYQKVADDDAPRMNFDVRDHVTGERIAVTDAAVGDRVRVGDSPYFLEVDGFKAGNEWRLFNAAQPVMPLATGTLSGSGKIQYQVRPEEFFTNLQIDETTKRPVNASNEMKNAALRVAVLRDGAPLGSEFLFFGNTNADPPPSSHPQFRLSLADIKMMKSADAASVDWNKPGEALFSISVADPQTGTVTTSQDLTMGETGAEVGFADDAPPDATAEAVPADAHFEVRVMEPAQRYMTILSVVNEPTVAWTNLGVVITVLGALMTFIFRYRAFYGLWDEARGTLRMALVPRWGQSPIREEFDALVNILSHGNGTIAAVAPSKAASKDAFLDVPETANNAPTGTESG